MEHAETTLATRIVEDSEDFETLTGIRETPLSRLSPEQAKPLAERVKQLHRRRTAVAVAKFNSGT